MSDLETKFAAKTLSAPKPFKAGDPLPPRLKLFAWGINKTNQGDFLVDELTAAALPQNQILLGRERVPMGFEHNIDPGSAEYERTHEPRPIASQGNITIVPQDGIYFDNVTWTEDGSQTIGNYEDISPTPIYDAATGRIVAIQSVSLTRTGSAYGLTLSAAAQAAVATLSATSKFKTQSTFMDDQKFLSIATLAAALKLPAEADEAAVVGAIAKLSTPPPAPALDLAAAKIKVGETEMTVAQLAANFVALETQFAASQKSGADVARENLIARLSAEGKAPVNPETAKPYSAEELGKLEPGTIRLLLVNTPVTVPLSARHRTAGVETGKELDPNLKGRDRVIAAFERENARTARI